MPQPDETEPNPPIPFGGESIRDDAVARLAESGERASAEWWLPDGPSVVLGRANNPATEIHADRCADDGVPVVRRLGGGGAVLLDEGSLCVTAAWPIRSTLIRPADVFRRINRAATDALAGIGVAGVRHAGISDWAVGDRKIAGSSLYAGRDGLLYQVSVLMRVDPDRIGRYLAHPTREPDYRRGRGHGEFLTSVEREGINASAPAIGEALADALARLRPDRAQSEAA